MALMRTNNKLSPVFAVDFDRGVVFLEDGTSWSVETWYDPLAQECTPDKAMACVFQGPHSLWFAVDLRDVHYPNVVH